MGRERAIEREIESKRGSERTERDNKVCWTNYFVVIIFCVAETKESSNCIEVNRAIV